MTKWEFNVDGFRATERCLNVVLIIYNIHFAHLFRLRLRRHYHLQIEAANDFSPGSPTRKSLIYLLIWSDNNEWIGPRCLRKLNHFHQARRRLHTRRLTESFVPIFSLHFFLSLDCCMWHQINGEFPWHFRKKKFISKWWRLRHLANSTPRGNSIRWARHQTAKNEFKARFLRWRPFNALRICLGHGILISKRVNKLEALRIEMKSSRIWIEPDEIDCLCVIRIR